jgi:hypothetical protein
MDIFGWWIMDDLKLFLSFHIFKCILFGIRKKWLGVKTTTEVHAHEKL